MKRDLVLCGVGGQGILSIAAVVDQAAVAAGYQVKQPEVHGMSQRGGAVHAFVRMSDGEIACDLPPDGSAEAILSVEPLEALRYVSWLAPEGVIVTDLTPVANLKNYPDINQLYEALYSLPRVIGIDATRLARKAGSPRAQNMVVLGAAAALLPLEPERIELHIAELFARKGEATVHANLVAFRTGRTAAALLARLVDAGVIPLHASRVVARLDLGPDPVEGAVLIACMALASCPDAIARLDQAVGVNAVMPLDSEALSKVAEPCLSRAIPSA
jgi:indolepyruvate ferredoxin oxidoreductase beta subunit